MKKKKIGVEAFANACVNMKNSIMLFVEDDKTSIERRMNDTNETIVLTIATISDKGIMREIKKADIVDWK